MKRYRIAVIAGDGVGQEVIPAGIRVLEAVAGDTFTLDFTEQPWGSDFYRRTGAMMPETAFEELMQFDAIYLGAVGWPDVPDHITLWGLLLPIRQRFDLFVNLRPIRLFPGVETPLRHKGPEDIDMVVVRENSEGEYSGVGGRVHVGLEHEVALQTDVFTRKGVEQVVRYAFTRAQERKKHLTSVTKSNASPYSFVFWDEIVDEVATEFDEVQVDRVLVDAAAAYFVTRPETFDVVVASNLFADILTDLGGAIQGSLGLAASANVNPGGGFPGVFEPVHGSAPDIAGKGIANPVGSVWAGALMLESLGELEAAEAVLGAVERVLESREVRTADLGGTALTEEMAEAIASSVG